MFCQGLVLVDRLDAHETSPGSIPTYDLIPFDIQLTFVGGVHTRDNLGEGRLTGTIVAQQGDNLFFMKSEVDILQSVDASKGLGDVAEFY